MRWQYFGSGRNVSDESLAIPISPEARSLLEQVDQDRANALMEGFSDVCRAVGATTPEIMWTIAMLEARVLATYEIGDDQQQAAMQFSDLLAAALPAAIMALEHAKMAMRGGQPS
jgi:predicted transcriptional regulator